MDGGLAEREKEGEGAGDKVKRAVSVGGNSVCCAARRDYLITPIDTLWRRNETPHLSHYYTTCTYVYGSRLVK